ncbi:AAA family ATPase [Nocardia sp. NPDC006044]|uniref:AAA family ATPase n=1 Tax=Nocardia sp. NPDC006044 TaxID=3364306 RepID=UPI0036B2271C
MPEQRPLGTLEEVNPPLALLPPPAPDALLPFLAPDAVHDLRGRAIDELQYPPMSALVVAGIPGAGKSTVLRRFFGATTESEDPSPGPEGSVVLDSLQARNRLRHRLGWLPYSLWRPVVHVAHFAGIRAALRDTDGPVVIHDCATTGWSRRIISLWAAGYGRELHLILLDVPTAAARAGQHARGRRSNRMTFVLHCFRWRRLMERLRSGGELRPAPESLVIVDRININHMSRVTFAA